VIAPPLRSKGTRVSSGSEDEPPQADEQMRAATEKLRHMPWKPDQTIDLTAEGETIDLTANPADADADADADT